MDYFENIYFAVPHLYKSRKTTITDIITQNVGLGIGIGLLNYLTLKYPIYLHTSSTIHYHNLAPRMALSWLMPCQGTALLWCRSRYPKLCGCTHFVNLLDIQIYSYINKYSMFPNHCSPCLWVRGLSLEFSIDFWIERSSEAPKWLFGALQEIFAA